MGNRLPGVGLFLKLANRGDHSFSLAQAFTPGTEEGNGFSQSPLGGFRSVERASPLEGGYTLYPILPPRRKRLGYGKIPLPLFSVRNLVNNPGTASRKTDRFLAAGFTLIELIIVISIMLILLSIAAPIYRTSVIRSKEAVLRDNLFTMRALIDQYTVDKQEAPQSLQDLVTAGYLRDVPMDPFTAANNTWEEVYETDVVMNPDQTASGITDVHSGSSLRSLAGDIYSSW